MGHTAPESVRGGALAPFIVLKPRHGARLRIPDREFLTAALAWGGCTEGLLRPLGKDLQNPQEAGSGEESLWGGDMAWALRWLQTWRFCVRGRVCPQSAVLCPRGAGKCSVSVHPDENSKFKLRLNSDHPLLGPCWLFGDFVCEFLL